MDYTYKGFGPSDDEEDYDWPEPLQDIICELCNRSVNTLSKHHLTPKSRGGSKGDTIMVCMSCKDMIHKLLTNKELDKEYNTLDKLKTYPKIKKYVKWIKNKKKERMPIASKKRKIK